VAREGDRLPLVFRRLDVAPFIGRGVFQGKDRRRGFRAFA
jgi:hypothetical protein